MKKTLLTAALTLLGCVGVALLTPQPADACRDHEAHLPASAVADGAIAHFLDSTEGMDRRERRAYVAGLGAEQKTRLRAEFQALPEAERKALAKELRMNPNKLRPVKAQTPRPAAATAEEPGR